MMLLYLFVIVMGLGWGLAVGSGLVAFLSVLDIIPRLTQLSSSHSFIRSYEWAIVLGALWFTWCDYFAISVQLPAVLTAVVGSFAGIFVGMLAAGLTEVLNVFPILTKRLGLHDYMRNFLMAMVLGKIVGSLLQWTFYL
ncbi:stage V sporulation protein AB [Brevibacillus laterosporus]|uniref:Stage V sporulation protein AB n=1 Tax=Brevibacillus laterosporus TaxID=1465 RepID=A0A0F7C0Z4_BRELA|nr:stage V sporulation protein AB [Brevibacillus laterosporus]AKF95370.1 stage V sporulation protein AB [Brevibacillus laterosporus]